MTAAAETLIEYERTDLGNALYFASEHRDLIRHDHRMKRWLIWSEHYWKPDYGPLLAQRVMTFVQNQYIEAATSEATLESRERRKTRHWGDANSARGMRAIAEIARNLPMLADDGKHWDEAPYLLGVPNGVVDLRTGELRDGHPDDRITMQARVPYDPSATAPRWERFLNEIHPDGEDGVRISRVLATLFRRKWPPCFAGNGHPVSRVMATPSARSSAAPA